MIKSIIGLPERFLGHGRHNRVNGHEQTIAAFAPFRKLILPESRIELLPRLEWLILIRHFLSLLVEGLACLLLLGGFFFLWFAITFGTIAWSISSIFHFVVFTGARL